MATIPCQICSEKGTVQQGRNCPACNGEKVIPAPEGFHMSDAHKIAMYRMLLNITDLVESFDIKFDAIDTKLDILETKIRRSGIMKL